MKHYIDTEFLEGTQKKTILGIPYGNTKPTIDLISIGIVAEDGREYYAISKEFNLKEAWNRFQRAEQTMFKKQNDFEGRKIYWLRDNVLKPIYDDLYEMETSNITTNPYFTFVDEEMNYKDLKFLLNKYGKSNKQIAEEIKLFVHNSEMQEAKINTKYNEFKPQFYGYFADYDWVVFCWLFGKMIDLPKGFPYYCVDLKQELDRKAWRYKGIDYTAKELKTFTNYPKQTNEHNALQDAIFCKNLHKFLNSFN